LYGTTLHLILNTGNYISMIMAPFITNT